VRTVFDGARRRDDDKTDEKSLAGGAVSSSPSRRHPGFLPCPGRKNTQRFAYFENTAHATPRRPPRRRRVAGMAEQTNRRGRIFTTGVTNRIAIRRTLRRHRQTAREFPSPFRIDSSGWGQSQRPDLDRIDPAALAQSAAKNRHVANPGRQPGQVDRDSGARRRARSRWFSILRFSGNGGADQRSCSTAMASAYG